MITCGVLARNNSLDRVGYVPCVRGLLPLRRLGRGLCRSLRSGIVQCRGMDGYRDFDISVAMLESMMANSGVFSRVSCLHLPCFVADFVYMVFDFVFGFQACHGYCRNNSTVGAGSCSRVRRYHSTVLHAGVMMVDWSLEVSSLYWEWCAE